MSGYVHDVIVLGAGVSGIYAVKRLTDLGLDAVVLEADDDLGGTWFRNRYPGCRFDSESYTYGYSWSQEILETWHWKELFSGQPENLRYLNFVADRFDLRRHMRFGSRVEAMVWEEVDRVWRVHLSDGAVFVSRFVVPSIGPLSIPTVPDFEDARTLRVTGGIPMPGPTSQLISPASGWGSWAPERPLSRSFPRSATRSVN